MSEINFLNIIQVLVAIALIGFILIQRGPGATAGSAFGGGASGTVFGAKGSGSFLTKATALLATAFFIITMLIAIDASETYAVSDNAEVDLGVFGSLEDDQTGMQNSETVTPSINDAATDVINAADEAIDGAAVEVEQTADEVVTEVQEAANDAADELDQAIETAEDADGDGN